MSNKKKYEMLGMPFGTAQNKLRKQILFMLLEKLGWLDCFRCGLDIESVDNLSVEHKKPWVNESADLFWDLENIAFSHASCNSGAHNREKTACKHGHTFDKENTKIRADGRGRSCKTCARERQRVEYKYKRIRDGVMVTQ